MWFSGYSSPLFVLFEVARACAAPPKAGGERLRECAARSPWGVTAADRSPGRLGDCGLRLVSWMVFIVACDVLVNSYKSRSPDFNF